MVRHVGNASRSLSEMIEAGEFEFYQAEQTAAKKPFGGADVIVSFLASEGGTCTFHGVYRVGASRPFTAEDHSKAPEFLKMSLKNVTDRIWYDLEELPDFNNLRGRLRVRWVGAIAWVQRKDMEILEILPPGRVRHFPGYQDVVLTWKELKQICESPRSHPDWVTAMKHTAAIYRIVDLKSEKIYIGSASGKEGLWKRWCDYAKTGNGGNKALIGLDHEAFQWSIVRTLSGVMAKRDVILVEQLEKRKHGTRAFGLNQN